MLNEQALFGLTLASLLAARLADALLDFYDVCELMGTDAADVQEAFVRSGINDFFPEDGEKFRAKSAILAEHVLGSLIPPAVCTNALSILVERLIDYRNADERYEESIPKILRFAVITRVFSGKDRRPFITHLYEKLLEAEYLRVDPQFWLQFAMARMEEKEWEHAGKCLETAYTTAKARPGYRTYMLDNQMARFYLLNALDGHSHDLDLLTMKVADLVSRRMSQMGDEIDVYVYRLVQPLINFREQLPLSGQSARTIDGLLHALREKLSEARRRRTLDDEEGRVWQTLSRR